jgi:hypothetical protein
MLQEELIGILSLGQSRSTVDKAIAWVGNDPAKFKAMVEVISGKHTPSLRDRAAWAFSYIAPKHPTLLNPHWGTFVKLLVNKKTSGPVKRNMVRFMQEVEIPVKYHGKITDRCFELVNDPQEDIAIRAFAITILGSLVSLYPALTNELRLSIEELLPYASAALKNRAGKILQKIEKMGKL